MFEASTGLEESSS